MADVAQRRAYLLAMGVQPWVRRDDGAGGEAADGEVADNEVAEVAVSPPAAADSSVSASVAVDATIKASSLQAPFEAVTSSLSPPVVGPVESAEPAAECSSEMPTPPVSSEPLPSEPTTALSSLDWGALQSTVSQCTACELHASRTQAVFGCGHHNAEWLIVGEAPGEDEDMQGEPFVGRAGQLLNNMLRAVDLSREQVYITNVIKCHPPADRNPHVDEISHCFGYLQRQIELLQPKMILVVGRVAAHALLKVNSPLGDLRGQVHRFANTPLIVTYHPAYLLRKPSEKAKSWSDLRLARHVLAGEAE